MANLTPWEPFRDVRRMHDSLDRMFDRALMGTSLSENLSFGSMPIDLYETDNDVIVKAAAPGIKPEELNITITGGRLNIRGEISEEHEDQQATYHLRERRFGSFNRSISLPASVDGDKAKADFENGILTLTIPKKEEAKPKTITIKTK
ncbi:MAG: Hsp20/alpha crystallin family protein [Anaerolineales bacterium]|nr:Hsp20/alpha crystallin family protein [Anaerolineales bacterium]